MACHLAFFLNSWRILKILGKIPMSKFLLNLLVQISKICKKSKFQIKYERILFLELWPSSGFWPSRGHLPSYPISQLSASPLGLSLPAGPACPTPPLTIARGPLGFLLPQDEADRAPLPSCAAPRWPVPASTFEMAGALTPRHFPRTNRSSPETAHNGAPLRRCLPFKGQPPPLLPSAL
jgi:hypothetical protein